MMITTDKEYTAAVRYISTKMGIYGRQITQWVKDYADVVEITNTPMIAAKNCVEVAVRVIVAKRGTIDGRHLLIKEQQWMNGDPNCAKLS